MGYLRIRWSSGEVSLGALHLYKAISTTSALMVVTILQEPLRCGLLAAALKTVASIAAVMILVITQLIAPSLFAICKRPLLHLTGIGHERFTYRRQGFDCRLTGIDKATDMKDIIA